jgi:hypothetical protein
MRRFVLVITALLFFFMAEQAFAGDNLSNATSKIESGISSISVSVYDFKFIALPRKPEVQSVA